jgi:hypothetical protein
MIEGMLDEGMEAGCVKSTFDNVTMENAFFER